MERRRRPARRAGIGAWNLVRGASAAFASTRGDVWFGLDRDPDPIAPGARLFHGREMARGRLAWAGFGYCLRPGPATFSYSVHVGRSEAEERGARGRMSSVLLVYPFFRRSRTARASASRRLGRPTWPRPARRRPPSGCSTARS